MLKFLHKPFPILSPKKIIRKRKIDNLYKDLQIKNSFQTNIPKEIIKNFYYDYLTCLKNKNIGPLENILEPRYFLSLKSYLSKTKKILDLKKNKEIKKGLDKIEIEFNGSLKIFGVKKNRLENEVFNDYTFIKNDDLLEFININTARKMITSEKKEDSEMKKNAEKVLKTKNELFSDKMKNFFINNKQDHEDDKDYNNFSIAKKLELKYKGLQKRDFILLEEFIIRTPLYLIPEFKGGLKISSEDDFMDIKTLEKNVDFVEHFVRIESYVDSKDDSRTLKNKKLFVVDFDDFMFGNPHYNGIEYLD